VAFLSGYHSVGTTYLKSYILEKINFNENG